MGSYFKIHYMVCVERKEQSCTLPVYYPLINKLYDYLSKKQKFCQTSGNHPKNVRNLSYQSNIGTLAEPSC